MKIIQKSEKVLALLNTLFQYDLLQGSCKRKPNPLGLG